MADKVLITIPHTIKSLGALVFEPLRWKNKHKLEMSPI